MLFKTSKGKLVGTAAASLVVGSALLLLTYEVITLHDDIRLAEGRLNSRIANTAKVLEFDLKVQSNTLMDKLNNLQQMAEDLERTATTSINSDATALLHKLAAGHKELEAGLSSLHEVGDQLNELRSQLRKHAELNRDAEYSIRQHVKAVVVKMGELEIHNQKSVDRHEASHIRRTRAAQPTNVSSTIAAKSSFSTPNVTATRRLRTRKPVTESQRPDDVTDASDTATRRLRTRKPVAESQRPDNVTDASDASPVLSHAPCPQTCSGRGLLHRHVARDDHSVLMCKCVCVDGWAGAECEKLKKRTAFPGRKGPLLSVAPRITVPDVPHHHGHQLSKDAACKLASFEYFDAKKDTNEYRSDISLKFFWSLFLKSGFVHRPCDEERSKQRGVGGFGKRLFVLDIGAGVGTNALVWENVFLNQTECLLDVTVLLVEANPVNAMLTRSTAARLQRVRSTEARLKYGSGFVVRNVAVAHYDGEGTLLVDEKQNRDKRHKGNERGRLVANNSSGDDDEGVHRIRVPVRTVRTLIADMLPDQENDNNFSALVENLYIPIMKIDVEGFEPAVLFGMGGDLLARTGAIVFECHKLWQQAEFGQQQNKTGKPSGPEGHPPAQTLENVVDFLSLHGFVTYKIGQRYWIPLTEPYWDKRYEDERGWGNCFAVRAASPEYDTLFSMHPKCNKLSSALVDAS